MQITFDTNNLTDTDRAVLRLVAENGWKRETYLADAKFDGPAQTIDVSDPVRDDSPLESAEPTENTPERDANGFPWDERIHSGTKALNADGTWRTKRGVDKALVAEVESELRNQTVVVESVEDNSQPVVTDGPAHQVAPPAPPAPPAPEAPSSPFPPPVAATSPFVALMKRVTTAQGSGKLPAQRVKELLESLDKKSIMDLRTDTDALDAFAVLLDGEGV